MLDGHGKLILYLRQVGIVCGRQAQNIKVRISAGEVYHLAFVSGKGHHIVRHSADDISKKAGVQDNITALNHISTYLGADAGLHIVARDRQLVVYMDQQTLQRGDGTLLGHGSAGDGDGILQKDLFAAELNHSRLPLCMECVAFQKKRTKVFRKSSRRTKACGKRGKPLK